MFGIVKRAGKEFLDDDCMSSGAALAYYTIFSLPPLLVLVLLITSAFGFSQEKVDQVVKEQLGMPTSGLTDVGGESNEAAAEEPTPSDTDNSAEGTGASSDDGIAAAAVPAVGNFGTASKIVGFLILVFSATGVFSQLQYALNKAWEVEPDPNQGGILSFFTKRLLSLGMIVVIGFLLLVSLVMTTLIDELVHLVQGGASDTTSMVIGIVLNNLAAFVVATILFAAMFKIMPDAEIRWRDVWMGAAATAILFVIGKALIGWYLQRSDMGSGWGGAAASMVGALVWVYYSSLIVLFGAELTQVLTRRYGAGIQPAEGAVRKVEEKHYVREG